MITIWVPHKGYLRPLKVTRAEQLVSDAVWIDLEKPGAEEFRWIMDAYHQKLPDIDELNEIEASSRFFRDEAGLHVRVYFLYEIPERTSNVTVGFVLNQERLFTLRSESLITFQTYRRKIEAQQESAVDAFGIMLGLFEIKVDRVADLLEQLHIELEKLNTRVFRTGESEFEDLLMLLATIQDRNDKTRLSLMDKQRALSFLLRSRVCPEEYLPLLREILQDIRSLDEHSTFLFEKVRFLLDATTGRVNITQNKIIKIFSIAAVVFLPPTLVASIYGMNFRIMPELSWPFGYPLAIILMVAAGIAPYWYFKHKDWL